MSTGAKIVVGMTFGSAIIALVSCLFSGVHGVVAVFSVAASAFAGFLGGMMIASAEGD